MRLDALPTRHHGVFHASFGPFLGFCVYIGIVAKHLAEQRRKFPGVSYIWVAPSVGVNSKIRKHTYVPYKLKMNPATVPDKVRSYYRKTGTHSACTVSTEPALNFR